jgi:hypothetical protein
MSPCSQAFWNCTERKHLGEGPKLKSPLPQTRDDFKFLFSLGRVQLRSALFELFHLPSAPSIFSSLSSNQSQNPFDFNGVPEDEGEGVPECKIGPENLFVEKMCGWKRSFSVLEISTTIVFRKSVFKSENNFIIKKSTGNHSLFSSQMQL